MNPQIAPICADLDRALRRAENQVRLEIFMFCSAGGRAGQGGKKATRQGGKEASNEARKPRRVGSGSQVPGVGCSSFAHHAYRTCGARAEFTKFEINGNDTDPQIARIGADSS